MIKIYGSKMSSAGRCMWLLEELAQPYEVVAVDMRGGEHKSPEFLALNPNGKVPVMVEDDFVLWESLAINEYLIGKFRPEWRGGIAQETALIAQWSYWSVANVAHIIEPLILRNYGRPLSDERAEECVKTTVHYIGILDKALSGREWLVGDSFTLADLNVASVIMGAVNIKIDLTDFSNVQRWLGIITERPAFKKIFTPSV